MSLQFLQIKCPENLLERLWDAFCIASIIGIWPRFIEPNLLFISEHNIYLPTLPQECEGIKIVQFSDLHFGPTTKPEFLKKICRKIQSLQPDVVVFTGDLISYSILENKELLKQFLQSISAPLGAFAIFGNHDYSEYASMGEDGIARRIKNESPALVRGFWRLLSLQSCNKQDPQVTSAIPEKESVRTLFEEGGFHVLHNETMQIQLKSGRLNIVGLGDMLTGNCRPLDAFSHYDLRYPGIVLSHNPDSFSHLQSYPGDLFLFGHTHGGQINLPYIWKKITPLKNKYLKSGFFELQSRYISVNRGLGSIFPFRWFAPPEISLFTLKKGGMKKQPILSRLLQRELPKEALSQIASYPHVQGKTSQKK